MKKLFLLGLLALLFAACEQKVDYGELYLEPTGKNNVYYWVTNTETKIQVEDGYTKYPIYIELPVGEYLVCVLHNDFFQTPISYYQENKIRIRKDQVTKVRVDR